MRDGKCSASVDGLEANSGGQDRQECLSYMEPRHDNAPQGLLYGPSGAEPESSEFYLSSEAALKFAVMLLGVTVFGLHSNLVPEY